MYNNKVFIVGRDHGEDSEPLDSREAAERWAFEHLPYGVLKCRTGSYVILEGTLCNKCGEFVEDKTDCENCFGKSDNEILVSRIAQAYFQAGKSGKNALTETASITDNVNALQEGRNQGAILLHDDLIKRGFSEQGILNIKRDLGL